MTDQNIFNSIVEEFAEIAGYLWQYGWAERNGGNISYNLSDCGTLFKDMKPISETYDIGLDVPRIAGSYFLVTGTGKRMRYVSKKPLENASVIKVDEDGRHYCVIAYKNIKPTSEIPSHLAIHNYLQGSRPEYKAIMHTHPIELVAMSHNPEFLKKDVLSNILWRMIPETLAFCPSGLGIIPYTTPGTVELGMKTIEKLDDYDVVLWEKHGVVSVGIDLIEAFDMVDTLSKSAKIYMSSCAMGFVPEGMNDQQMEDLRQLFNIWPRNWKSLLR